MAPLQKGSKYTNGCVLLFCLVSLIAEDQKILDGEREQNENLTLAKPAAGKKKKVVAVESFQFAPGLVVGGPQQALLAQEGNRAARTPAGAAGDPLATAG